jgi:CelD/BcsL family acetyltransferase involved in cellulose biosynthesis
MIEKISIAEFEQLREPWNALLRSSRSNCLFLTWEWLHVWWRHLADSRELSVLRVTSEGELIGLLPLALTRARLKYFRPRTLELMGAGDVGSDYLDFIVREGCEAEVLREASEYFANASLTIRLPQHDSCSAIAARLAAQWRERGAPFHELAINVCPTIHLEGRTWDSYLATLGAEHRYNFRRKLKNLSRRFDMRFEAVDCEAARRPALERLISLHLLRRRCLGGSEAFDTSQLRVFHDEFTRAALNRGWLRLFTMWLNDEPAAALYGFLYDGVFSFYQSGFDPRFGGQSVGLVMMGLAIQRAIDEGAREYDLLHGAERYKFHWADSVRRLSCLELYPPGRKGSFWKAVSGWNRGLRSMARKMLVTTRTDALERGGTVIGGDLYAAGRG